MKSFIHLHNLKYFTVLIIGLILVTGCRHKVVNSVKPVSKGTPVSVASIRTGQMETYIELNAISEFLNKSEIKSPVTGYIDNVLVNQGDRVEKSRILYKIRTKEAVAISGDSLNDLKFRGIVDVKAATSGTISSFVHSKGDYIAEGDPLCQISVRGDLVFILDVPFELSGYVILNTPCEIILPDNRKIEGIIKFPLPSMMGDSQTERYIIQLPETTDLPENLSGKVRVVKEFVKDAIILPQSSILTDETMQSFWVMKLINDSTAVKVPVKTGISADDYVQITSPVFGVSDRILISGNYGVNDTVAVIVLKTTGNE
jgi:multidrug efflux pump subunit AcrA (membrane-fusion protein)